MTLAEALAAVQALGKAGEAIANLIADHERKIAALEAQVQKHDAALEHATLGTK